MAFGAMIVPRHVIGGVGFQPPSATLNIAICGAGGMGMQNLKALLSENIVAICDVDFPYVERTLATELRARAQDTPAQVEAKAKLKTTYEKAAKYADFREMLDKQRDIDAVLVATPDHSHAIIAVTAMKAGKHVYVQKPMAYSVHECRVMARVAKETGRVTQMGNQGHSREGTRRINEWIAAGVIGPVREVHIFTNRPVNYWAQGIPRPVAPTAPAAASPAAATTPPGAPVPPKWDMGTVNRAVLAAMAANPQNVPEGLHWDLFLGGAPDIAYHPVYHPFSWRGWVDFGGGALGDMGAHLVDQPYWALGLTYPTTISGSSSPWGGGGRNVPPASYPLATTAQWEFAARGSQPPVKLFWYDSGILPPRPPFLPDDMDFPNGDGGGGVFVGDKGILTYKTYGDEPRIFPDSLHQEAQAMAKTFPRVEGSHEMNWAQACKGETKASSPFEYASGLVETMLLGVVALRTGQGKRLLYDGPNMRVTNIEAANQYLTRAYRDGWSV
jgi:predicted dehydrogenase